MPLGQDQWRGAKDAFDKMGIEVEYLESPVGTSDFTPYMTKIMEMNPEIVRAWRTGAPIRLTRVKQASETGLKKKSKIWLRSCTTNVFGSGVPPEAIEGVYSLMSWYYDLSGFPDEAIVKQASAFSATSLPRHTGILPIPIRPWLTSTRKKRCGACPLPRAAKARPSPRPSWQIPPSNP